MNTPGFVKEEFPKLGTFYSGEPSAAVPKPLKGLHETSHPPFLTKTYDLVDDLNTNHIISWSRGNNSFVVWDPQAFAMNLLPKYFKHNNFSSFVRQLNTYGFRKVDPDRREFANEAFLRGQKHLLRNIRRRKTTHMQQGLEPCVEVGRFGLDAEIYRLRHDKEVLMVELVKLRQKQQSTRAYLKAMEERLRGTEMKQRQMMGFLARSMQNPIFLQQLTLQKDRRKEIEEEICRKKRRAIEQGHIDFDVGVCELGQIGGEICGFCDLEMGELVEREEEGHGSGERVVDEGFWEDLLSEGIEEEIDLVAGEGEDEDVDLLAKHLGFLVSNPK
ncbi:Heat stress transcription factor A-6b like [Actinidia chinensis var. chinensis]|uniref:Heat stress transcription factor n=1 Tax=Actinidia chinensis var. chinensis TaxID=1590841 RepID=A0A2R6RUZ1_ACTCC|nr:Heat stress transcription factor A-6b like [Actinidia chinensis var. chinensis]